jgi:hypothetical protein
MIDKEDPWNGTKRLRQDCDNAFGQIEKIINDQGSEILRLSAKIKDLENSIIELTLTSN